MSASVITCDAAGLASIKPSDAPPEDSSSSLIRSMSSVSSHSISSPFIFAPSLEIQKNSLSYIPARPEEEAPEKSKCRYDYAYPSYPSSYRIAPAPMHMNNSMDFNEVSTGTTITACKYKGGVILGADSRTSAGSYVVNRAARKISCLHDRICVCRSGSAADTQTLTNIVKFSIQQYVHELPPGTLPRVRAVSQLFRRLCYDYKDHLSAGLIVAGIDDDEGPQIYSIPIGGAVVPMKYASGGSGSIYISAYMDDNWKENMSKEEAKKYISKSVAYAMSRDGSSGGLIRMICIERDSVEESCIYGKQLPVPPS